MSLETYLVERNATGLVDYLQHLELEKSLYKQPYPESDLHLVALLIVNDMNEARLLIRRNTERSLFFKKLVEITNLLWTGQSARQQVLTLRSQCPEPLAQALDWLNQVLTSRMLQTLTTFESIHKDRCALYLGVTVDELPSLIQQAGWTINNDYIIPVKVPSVVTGRPVLEDLGRLADYSVQLQR